MGLFDFFKKNKSENKDVVSEENNLLESGDVLENSSDFEIIPVEETIEEVADEIEEEITETVTDEIEEVVEEVAEEIEEEITETVEEVVVETVTDEIEETIEEVAEVVVETVEEEVAEAVEEVIVEAIEEEITEVVKEVATEEVEEEVEEVVTEEIQEEIEETQEPKKKGFFAKLKEGLDKTRKSILGGVDTVLGGFTKIDEDLFEELEETLIMSDIGVETTMYIVENLRKRVKKEHTTDPMEIKVMLADEISKILTDDEDENLTNPSVLLVIGVNGVGKTTTIGKLGNKYKREGKTVILGAADTFRAAAIEQLEIWGERSNIPIVKQSENSDPAAVVFDATTKARNDKYDLLICDTAGRLHNKKNLMEELRKISKVIDREHPSAHRETYLVLDATTGQNALQQAKVFQEVADITGIILTKLDGTAKGGIVVAIKHELNIPVRYIGVGEGIDDLQKFSATDFSKALFGE